MSEFDNLTTPPPAPAGGAPQEQRTLALLAHLLGIVTGPIGALVIWLISKDDASKGFVTDQSKEALNFQITVFLAFIVAWVLSFVLIGLLLVPLIALANLVFCILAAVKANSGEAYRYPATLRLIG